MKYPKIKKVPEGTPVYVVSLTFDVLDMLPTDKLWDSGNYFETYEQAAEAVTRCLKATNATLLEYAKNRRGSRQMNETYWTFNPEYPNADVFEVRDNGGEGHRDRFENGYYFETKAEAQETLKKLREILK